MRRPEDRLYAGIDLHSNNAMFGIANQDSRRVTHRKLDCDLQLVLHFLESHKANIESMAVESTFNWHWLLDGLRAAGYPIDLARKLAKLSSQPHHDSVSPNETFGPRIVVPRFQTVRFL